MRVCVGVGDVDVDLGEGWVSEVDDGMRKKDESAEVGNVGSESRERVNEYELQILEEYVDK